MVPKKKVLFLKTEQETVSKSINSKDVKTEPMTFLTHVKLSKSLKLGLLCKKYYIYECI